MKNEGLQCSIEGCAKPAKCRGWCATHYHRFFRHGDPMVLLSKPVGTQTCIVTDCGAVATEIAMCGKHAQRMRRYGDPLYVTPEMVRRERSREANLRPAKPTSYRKLLGRHEHRAVAEKMLGRPLQKGEIVHHVDGDRHNNAPENLRVMTQAEHINEHRQEMIEARRRVRAS